MKVALVYDRVNKWGGAEGVLLALHKLIPDAPLYTSIYDRKKAPWASVFNVKTSFLQNFPFATRHELYAWLMPLAFESFSFDEYDLVISITSEAGKGIITKPGTLHICYCLTPTRYLWSGYDDYFRNSALSFVSKPFVTYLKAWDKVASQRPDFYIAISKEVQARIKRYYERDSVVVYPPLTLMGAEVAHENFLVRDAKKGLSSNGFKSPASSHSENFVGSPRQIDYYLIVSRLVPYKRIDIAIRAFNKLKLPLKIIGTGSHEKYLKSISGPTIEFLGYLTESELVRYYSDCRALIFPGIEDFGLTALEAQSFGNPVIAYRGGGALETIIEGKTGLFFNQQTAESLSKAIEQFNNTAINQTDCIKNTERFSFERFKKEFMKKILRYSQNEK